MSGIVNKTGAVSGVIGTTVGTPVTVGHVVQTVATPINTETYIGGTSYTLATNFSGVITPIYSNSKILIMFSCGGMAFGGQNDLFIKITGTTTGIVSERSRYAYTNVSNSWTSCAISLLVIDTPGTTATQTYQLYGKTDSDNTVGNWRIMSESQTGIDTQSGTVIVQEIKV